MREVMAGETNCVLSQIPASLDSRQPPLQLLARATLTPWPRAQRAGSSLPTVATGPPGLSPSPRWEGDSNASTASFSGPGALAAAHGEIPVLFFLITHRVTNNIWKTKTSAQPAPARGVQHPAEASPSSTGSGVKVGFFSQGIYLHC